MELAELKFCFSSRIMMLLATIFIILSGVAESRQCYWCGPLADQVHRSRRPPPCSDSEAHLTTCDSAYQHCAIVATSPPYTESRYCVKLYQDECYPLFCNSTKTWRMTCPCRGDLCNGENTERETDAFTVLARLVAKTHSRIKRRVKSNYSIRKGQIINENDEQEVAMNSVDKVKQESTSTSEDMHKVSGTTQETDRTENKESSQADTTPMPKEVETKEPMTTIDVSTLAASPSVYLTSTNMIELEFHKSYSTHADRHGIYKSSIDINIQADAPMPEKSSSTIEVSNIEQITQGDAKTKTAITSAIIVEPTKAKIATLSTEALVVATEKTPVESDKKDNIKPKEPTAEAFQENAPVEKEILQTVITTTAEKLTDSTTITTTTAVRMDSATTSNIGLHSQTSKNKTKNSGICRLVNVVTIICGLTFNYLI